MGCGALLLAVVTVASGGWPGAGSTGTAPDAISQEATAQKNPFVGTWTADLSKSMLHPNYPLQSATLSFVVAGEAVTITSAVVLASGQKQDAAETFHTDGTERPGTHTPGVTLSARWIGTHVLETMAKKEGQSIGVLTYEVSADGKTLTSRSSGPVALEQVIVFDRR